jgi:hypothetical protein
VGPRAPDQALTLGLRIRSRAPRADLSLTVTVYDHLTSRSGFTETLSGRGLGGVTARSPALALTSLTTDAQGVTTLTIPVVGDTTPPGGGDWTADLGCAPGSCADVYPVKVTLTDSAPNAGGAQLVTYLVYDDPSSTSQPLRVALVAPLGLAPPAADATGKVHPPRAGAVAALDSLVGAIGAAPAVPMTLAPDPATLEYLVGAGHAHQVDAVGALSTSPARQTLSQSFVPVDPTALADAGLPDETTAQERRASQVLALPALGVRATTGTWVAGSTLDQAAVDQLAPAYGHVVVPQSTVTGPTGPLTTTQPFALSAGRGASVTAAVSDAGLGAHLAAGSGGDPVLAAEQFLADLSLVYYEAPNLLGPEGTPAPRGVVAVAPLHWAPDPTFVTAALGGLEANPVVDPVTLDQLFTEVPVGADRQATARRPVPAGPPGLPARALRTARVRQEGFESAASASPAGAVTAQTLGDLLLTAEASTLTPHQQQAAVTGYEAVLAGQLRQLSVRSDTIRLTAGAASVPLTLVRNTPYPVTVVVRLTSDKLRFPASQSPGSVCRDPHVTTTDGRSTFSALCVLDRATDAVYVNMRARTAGDFRVDVTLASPRSGLELAGGELTVRSLSTSAVAIALSVAAVLVLLAWWGRTLWRGGRWSRRGAHSRAAPAGAGAGNGGTAGVAGATAVGTP